jgi:hypothetical protein
MVRGETYLSTTLSTTNVTWADLESNPGVYSEKHGTFSSNILEP